MLQTTRKVSIHLGSEYANPLDIGLNIITKNWAGFIKLHLKYPLKDGIALLKGERAFVMEMENGEKVIAKVEKGFELATKARNLRLHIKGNTLRDDAAHVIFKELVRERYYAGKQLEFLTLTKPDPEKDFAFLTLATEEARDAILEGGLKYKYEKLHVNIPRDREAGNSSELRISTTLVVNNLPQKESQSTIVKTMKKLFGEDNIVGMSFGHASTLKEEKQYGWCHIQCLNAAVYTEWVNKSAHILGRRIDFIAHKGSIDGTEPNNTAIRLAQAPPREAIAQKIQAMTNAATTNPPITEKYLNRTMQEWEERLDGKFATMVSTINLNTDRRTEEATDKIITQANNLHAIVGTLAYEIQMSNQRMQGIVQNLTTQYPEILQRPQAPSTSMHTTAPALQLQPPPGFPNGLPSHPPHNQHQSYNPYNG